MRKTNSRVVLAIGGAIGVIAAAACGTTADTAPTSPTVSRQSTSPTSASSSPSPSQSGPTSLGHASACRASALKLTLVHTGAVTGEEGGYIQFTNQGRTSCRIDGWPTVVAQTKAGKATSVSRALHGIQFGGWQYAPPQPVLLMPGASGYAVVAAGDVSAGPTTHCPTYRWLRVRPPGTSRYVMLSAWLPGAVTFMPACTSVTGSSEIEVSVVVPLSDLVH
jgi:hypothetical protein